MPFGLKNAPSTFQRMIDHVLDGLMKICTPYLDDILVFGKTKAELYENLATVFDWFRQSDLKLKPKNASFSSLVVSFWVIKFQLMV